MRDCNSCHAREQCGEAGKESGQQGAVPAGQVVANLPSGQSRRPDRAGWTGSEQFTREDTGEYEETEERTCEPVPVRVGNRNVHEQSSGNEAERTGSPPASCGSSFVRQGVIDSPTPSEEEYQQADGEGDDKERVETEQKL
ncbi:hypothetical protein [Streptomyces sp. NPDC087270]|uniref:hypothetical protein n=1 Tax=Streptomyces sp. NPDC087270 TaxID=3365774 RepID=UPI0037FBC636